MEMQAADLLIIAARNFDDGPIIKKKIFHKKILSYIV